MHTAVAYSLQCEILISIFLIRDLSRILVLICTFGFPFLSLIISKSVHFILYLSFIKVERALKIASLAANLPL